AVVGGEAEVDAAAEAADHAGEVEAAGADVEAGVERARALAEAIGELARGRGHELHQALGAAGAAGARVELALDPDHGVDEARIEPVLPRGRLDVGLDGGD